MDKKKYTAVLSIAGSDSGGGAGIQADIKTISSLGCYAYTVITAITAQNTKGVFSVENVSIDAIKAQLDAVLTDIPPKAVKIGMLSNADTINSVADKLEEYAVGHIVLDPVIYAKSGDRLLEKEAIIALKERLIPKAAILTPNRKEALDLAGYQQDKNISGYELIKELDKLGGSSIYLKYTEGTEEEAKDYYYRSLDKHIEVFRHAYIETNNSHGSGCTLSSALACYLALNESPSDAAMLAHEYVHNALKSGAHYQLGKGKGPLHHFFNFWS